MISDWLVKYSHNMPLLAANLETVVSPYRFSRSITYDSFQD